MEAEEVNPRKAEKVQQLLDRIASHRVVGIASVEGIPALQLQRMRRSLRGKAALTVTKNSLLQLALEQASRSAKGLGELSKVIQGQTALVVSDLNAFKLFRELEATKTKAPARGGEVAPDDVVVKAGDTPFKPGPIVGELQKAGISAAIDRGKVVIRQDKVLVKKGDRIPREAASVLTRLEIYPVTVGLDLRGAFENGMLFRRDVLAVDPERVRWEVVTAARQAFNLAMFAWIPTPATTGSLVARAHRQALALAAKAGYVSKATAPVLLRQAQGRALALASLIAERKPEALDEDLRSRLARAAPRPAAAVPAREEKKEEKKEEKVSEEEAASGLGALFG